MKKDPLTYRELKNAPSSTEPGYYIKYVIPATLYVQEVERIKYFIKVVLDSSYF